MDFGSSVVNRIVIIYWSQLLENWVEIDVGTVNKISEKGWITLNGGGFQLEPFDNTFQALEQLQEVRQSITKEGSESQNIDILFSGSDS